MSDFRVTATCGSGHVQKLVMEDSDRVSAEVFAGLTDGTFPGYISPPGPESVIGKCGVCGSPFKCTVEEVDLRDRV